MVIMKKDSFVIYTEKEVFLKHLSDAQKARILEAFFAYADERELPEMDAITSVVWEVFSLDFDRNNEKYERVRKARAEAGKKHKGNQYCSDKMEQNGTDGTNGTNGTDNVNVNVNVDVNDNVNVPSICKDNIKDCSCENSQPTDQPKKEPPKTLEERQREFYDDVAQYVGKYDKEMLRAFYDYWSEPNQKNTKMRKELEKTWSTGGRLATWYRRQNESQNINNQQLNNKNYGNNQQNYRKEGLSDAEILEAVAGGFALFNASKRSDNQ